MKTETQCEWCRSKPATKELPDGYKVCKTCLPKVNKYYKCKICKCNLPPALGGYARVSFALTTCIKPKCLRAADIKMGHLCCDKAEYINCVCARAYKCPVHGEVHVGTHD